MVIFHRNKKYPSLHAAEHQKTISRLCVDQLLVNLSGRVVRIMVSYSGSFGPRQKCHDQFMQHCFPMRRQKLPMPTQIYNCKC